MVWTDLLNDDPTDWLIEAEPWTRYRTLIDPLDRPPDDAELAARCTPDVQRQQLRV